MQNAKGSRAFSLFSATFVAGVLLLRIAPSAAAEGAPVKMKNQRVSVENLYPGLCMGLLCEARVEPLKGDVLLRADRFEITRKELSDLIKREGGWLQDEYARFSVPLLEQYAERKLLTTIARERTGTKEKAHGKQHTEPADVEQEALIDEAMARIAGKVTVTDADVATYYKQNAALFGGAGIDEVRDYIRQLLKQRAREEAVQRFFHDYASTHHVVVDENWLRSAAPKALANPVDRLRGNGTPLLAAFSVNTGCTACGGGRETEAVLDIIGETFVGRVQTFQVDLRETPGMGLRFRIRDVPTYILFAGDGGELLRVEGVTSPRELLERVRQVLPEKLRKTAGN